MFYIKFISFLVKWDGKIKTSWTEISVCNLKLEYVAAERHTWQSKSSLLIDVSFVRLLVYIFCVCLFVLQPKACLYVCLCVCLFVDIYDLLCSYTQKRVFSCPCVCLYDCLVVCYAVKAKSVYQILKLGHLQLGNTKQILYFTFRFKMEGSQS